MHLTCQADHIPIPFFWHFHMERMVRLKTAAYCKRVYMMDYLCEGMLSFTPTDNLTPPGCPTDKLAGTDIYRRVTVSSIHVFLLTCVCVCVFTAL